MSKPALSSIQINESVAEIIKNNKKLIKDVETLLEKLLGIHNEKTEILMSIITENIKLYNGIAQKLNFQADVPNQIADYFLLINNIEKCSLIINIIYTTLGQLIDKTNNIETYLSQTFINETFKLYKSITVIYRNICKSEGVMKANIISSIVQNELKNKDLIADPFKYSKVIQQIFHSQEYSIDLYTYLMNNIIKMTSTWQPENKQLFYSILSIIEDEKTRILNQGNKVEKEDSHLISKTKMINPYYKSFGLIPVSELLPIDKISQLIFNKPCKTLNDFLKICKEKEYGLIIIKKIIAHPISYKTSQLFDWKKSQEFDKIHKRTYGVDVDLLERYQTIYKIDNKAKWDFSYDTHVFKFDNYEDDKEKFIIVLDSLVPDFYRIVVNFISSNKYFIRVSSIRELYLYCMKDQKSQTTRIGRYNSLCIEKSIPLIFSPIKINLEKLAEVSSIIDPKYLRNQIFLLLGEEFNQIITKKYQGGKKIKDNYTYASIIHNDKFLNIFSDVLTNEFHSYLSKTYNEYATGHINISEITVSFLNVIYIYQRTFVKEMHDYFKDNLFNFDIDGDSSLQTHFNLMAQKVLNKIITNDSNIYQTIIYKINLLKTTLV